MYECIFNSANYRKTKKKMKNKKYSLQTSGSLLIIIVFFLPKQEQQT